MATLHLRNQIGENLLHIAIRGGHVSACEKLLEEGADPDELRSDGWAPVHLVQNPEVLRVLIKYGCAIHQLSSQGSSALNVAVTRRNRPVGRVLIDAGVDVDAYDRLGYTALNIAMYLQDEEFVRMLVEAGADCNLADKYGNAPLGWITPQIALQLRLLGRLRSHGADVEALSETQREGISLIEAAARFLSLEATGSFGGGQGAFPGTKKRGKKVVRSLEVINE